MLENINLDEVRQYNNSLKAYKEKAASLKAEIEYNTKELESLCSELSTELGVEVNSSNIESIYNEQVEKIKSDLNTGNAVLAKIANEQQAQAVQQSNPVQTQTPVQAQVPVQPVQQPVVQQQVSQPQVAQSTPVTTQPTAASPFMQAVPTVGQNGMGTLPPLFSV